MKMPRIIIAMVLLVMFSGYSHTGALFPSVAAADSAPLEIQAQVGDTRLVTGTSNQVTLPATVLFTSNEPATVYYTTNGTDPTTATTTRSDIAAPGGVATGPTITGADSILVILGEDAAGNLTSVQSYTFAAP